MIVSVAVGFALAMPGIAVGSETIGQTGADISCVGDQSYVQKSVAAQTPYSPSAHGVITSWSAAASADTDQTAELLVLRPGAGTEFTAVQKDVVRTLSSPNALNSFTGLHLPIEPTDRIGVYVPTDSNYPCEFETAILADEVAFTPISSGEPPVGAPLDFSATEYEVRVNVQATVEPDADRDGFGDETQDQCPSNASTQGPCPVHKKKCKKHKKHSASAAKKRCKKKKH